MEWLTALGEYIRENESVTQRLVGTTALLVSALFARSVALRFMRSLKWREDSYRVLWHLRVRHMMVAAIAIGLAIIWASQLRDIALSAVAVAVAVVIATKELFLCVSGSFLRTATEAFTVGDRIEVGGVRGDVVAYGLFGTVLVEIGPTHLRTGRAIVIPNSQFLTAHVINETYTDEYVIHVFAIPLPRSQQWIASRERLLEIAQRTCAEHVGPAREYMQGLSARHGLPHTSVEPRVSFQLPDKDTVNLLVRVPLRARDKGVVEQTIIAEFLGDWREGAVGDPQPAG